MEAKMIRLTMALAAFVFLPLLTLAHSAYAQDETDDAIKRATDLLNRQQQYELRYKLKVGDVVRWTYEHTESTKMRMAGDAEDSSSRCVAYKRWEVQSIDSKGNITLVAQMDSAEMWQQTGESAPVSYNTLKDKEPPLEYESIADQFGRPIATISITPFGQVVSRQDHVRQAKLGMGDVTIPMPAKKISINHTWTVPGNLSAKDEHGIMNYLDTRVRYTLTKVKDGLAYISFRTEVLTPINSKKVQSKIMQHMTDGTAIFDIKRGLIVRRIVDWNETVQGFEGAGSYLKYVASFNERWLQPKPKVSQSKIAKLDIKPIDGKPILRR